MLPEIHGKPRQSRTSPVVSTILLLLFSVSSGFTQSIEETGSSTLAGTVEHADTRTAIANAEVLAFRLEDQKIYRTTTTANGSFLFEGMPYGYYDLAVQVGEDVYPAGDVINLTPRGKVIATLRLIAREDRPDEFWNEYRSRSFLGETSETDGVAQLQLKRKGRDFWRTGKGIAIISTIGGATLLAIAVNDDSTPQSASPINPVPTP
jgi:hypothetical protein